MAVNLICFLVGIITGLVVINPLSAWATGRINKRISAELDQMADATLARMLEQDKAILAMRGDPYPDDGDDGDGGAQPISVH